MRKGFIIFAFLLPMLFGSYETATADELSGTVYSQGTPIANLSVTVKENGMQTRTGPRGNYSLQLPPGNYTLIIRGSEIAVTVPASGKRFDINL